MKLQNRIWRLIAAVVFSTLICLTLMAGGCSREKTKNENETALSSVQAPDAELDMFLFFKQKENTILDADWFGFPEDIAVESLAVWGIVEGTEYAVGGALFFKETAEASYISTVLPEDSQLWYEVSGRTIYAVYGSGAPFVTLKSAVVEKRFKNFDNQDALKMAAALPGGTDFNPVMLGMLDLNQDVIELIKSNAGSEMSGTLDDLVKWAKPRMLVGALYSAKQIGLEDLDIDTIDESQMGAVAVVRTGYPGLLFEPVAKKYLNSQGYNLNKLGKLDVYRTDITAGDSSLPFLMNISGNRIFGVSSFKLEYCESLMTAIVR